MNKAKHLTLAFGSDFYRGQEQGSELYFHGYSIKQKEPVQHKREIFSVRTQRSKRLFPLKGFLNLFSIFLFSTEILRHAS